MTGYLTREDLKSRGWGPKPIQALKHDKTERIRRDVYRYLYAEDRILEIESTSTSWKKRSNSSTPADPKACDILSALWAINRNAKRCRDAAQKHYRSGTHGFARTSREQKEEMYRLKGQCLHWLLAERRLLVAGYHRNQDGMWMEILRGAGDDRKPDGYTFHRPCPEPKPLPQDVDTVSVEAKPKDKREPRLKDAMACVRDYLYARPKVEVFQWPRRVRQVTCYNCGRPGHVAADCDDFDSEVDRAFDGY